MSVGESRSQGIVRKKVDESPKTSLAATRRVQASKGTPNASEVGLLPLAWEDMR